MDSIYAKPNIARDFPALYTFSATFSVPTALISATIQEITLERDESRFISRNLGNGSNNCDTLSRKSRHKFNFVATPAGLTGGRLEDDLPQ